MLNISTSVVPHCLTMKLPFTISKPSYPHPSESVSAKHMHVCRQTQEKRLFCCMKSSIHVHHKHGVKVKKRICEACDIGGWGAAATLYTCNMYDVSTEGVDERMINVHYYYYTAASVLVLIVPETGVCEGENNNNHSLFLYTSVSCALNIFALVQISLMCSEHLCSCTDITHVL